MPITTGRKKDTSEFLNWDRSYGGGAQYSADRGHLFTVRRLWENGQPAYFLTIMLAGSVLYRRPFRTAIAAKVAAEGFRKESSTFRGIA